MLRQVMNVINRKINIGLCLGVNIRCKLEHTDLCDTTFTFVLRHDTFRAVSTRQYKTETKGI
jgi:hypothetical protein